MRKILDFLILVGMILAGALVVYYRGVIIEQVHDLVYGPPCSRPIAYSVGEIDPRFGLPKEKIVALIKQAAETWDETSGRNLFEYRAAPGGVVVNFKYDRRQEATELLSDLESTMSKNSADRQALKVEYTALNEAYTKNKAIFEAHNAAVLTTLEKYNAEVALWNSRGGAPSDVLRRLESERAALEVEHGKLDQEAAALDSEILEINALAAKLNGGIAIHNSYASQYNSISASTGPEFDEGEYKNTDGQEEIDVYQFADQTKLIRVLIHEFGHAIGLGHVSDPAAIMYKTNLGRNTTLAAADIAALTDFCGK